MLTDAPLKQLKPKGKPFKVSDRGGMYAHEALDIIIALKTCSRNSRFLLPSR